ncbi:MAG: hypothetical protein KBG22_01125 [Smithella sp.]|nr:hypothetical protein [Smithella sp.]
MDESKIMVQEYNNLWNEKLIHKQNIRKFHNYLTYFTAIGSLALTFHGVSAPDLFKASIDSSTANNIANKIPEIVNIFLILLTPILIMTLTFPINDIFHTYAIGNQIGQIECKINSILENDILLLWEHSICPAVYGGEKVFESDKPITNVISFGDYTLLLPTLYMVIVFSTYISVKYLCEKSFFFSISYSILVIYMIGALLFLGSRLKDCTSPNSLLNKVISYKNRIGNKKLSVPPSANGKKKHSTKK